MEQNNKEKFEHLRIGSLKTGEVVYDKPESHIHEIIHKQGNLPELLSQIESSEQEFIIKEFKFEDKTFPSYRVSVDPEKDDLFLAQRKGREGYSVFVRNRDPEPTDTITLILRRSDSYPGDTKITPVREGYTLATVFTGEMAEREPWDPWFDEGQTEGDIKERQKLKKEVLEYWQHSAFIPNQEELPVIEGTERPFNTELLLSVIK